MSFEEEYLKFLNLHATKYDERFVLDKILHYPTFHYRPPGLPLHAGLEPYNRYRDLGKFFHRQKNDHKF